MAKKKEVVEEQLKLPMPVAYQVVLRGAGNSTCDVGINGTLYRYKRGEVVVVPPNVYHILTEAGEVESEKEPLYE